MPESINQNIEPKKYYHFSFKAIATILSIIIFLLIGGHLLTYHYINKEKEDRVQIINNILSNVSKEKALIPDIILIGKKDSTASFLDSVLKKELINFLTNKYAEGNPNANKVFDIKPYLSSSDIKDEDKIIKHIEFLSETVKNAVEDSKRNIDTEISKINTWVTIWIGIIGFIGIFLPIVINIKSFDELKEIQKDAAEAKRDSGTAMGLLDKHKDQLEGLEGKMSKVDKLEERIGEISDTAATADKNATNAEQKSTNTEKLLYTLNMVFKLKDIDGAFLMYNKEPLKVLIKYFEEIHKELSDTSIDFKHPFVFDALRQLALRLYVLAPYAFVSKENMTLFNNLSEFISAKLEAGLTEDSFKEILKEFNDLITTLKSN